MFHSIRIVGRGRVGTAFTARLTERGHRIDDACDLVLLCVPDAAIAEVARSVEPGPWIAHTSGATPLAASRPTSRGSACILCKRSCSDAGPNSSTARGPR